MHHSCQARPKLSEKRFSGVENATQLFQLARCHNTAPLVTPGFAPPALVVDVLKSAQQVQHDAL